jgi:hypothetical protein
MIRGPSHIASNVEHLQHPAGPLLVRLRTQGMPVVTRTPRWSAPVVQERLSHGSHKSTDEHLDFVRDEMADFARKGFWTVLPCGLVKRLRGLRLSPSGCVPQRRRRPQLIVDLSYYGVNVDNLKLAPHEAMQFGHALDRLLYRIQHTNPKYGPVYMNKIDVSDGFYCVWLAANSAPKLAVVLPSRPGEEPLIAIPLMLPMGWVESPPAFCAVTETVADIANWRLPRWYAPPPPPIGKVADTPPPDVAASLPTPDRIGVHLPFRQCASSR